MPPTRVTMEQVARAAGVHQTTVSLALRNDARLPEATRTRIRKIADKLGYRPDPALSALNYYRTARQPKRDRPTIAFLANFTHREHLEASRPHRLFFEGGRRHAERMGYRLELFCIGRAPEIDGRRIERVLHARGIDGVILGAIGHETTRFEMEWSRFSAVAIESQQLGHALHTVANHQLEIAREAVARLHALGYRRIGLAVGERGEIIFRQMFSAGYMIEVAERADLQFLPPLRFKSGTAAELAAAVKPWLDTHEPDVVASNWAIMPEVVQRCARRVPQNLAVATLDHDPTRGPNWGMAQNHETVGERAVEQLAFLLKSNHRGGSELPNHILIGGRWIGDSDVPAKRATAEGARR